MQKSFFRIRYVKANTIVLDAILCLAVRTGHVCNRDLRHITAAGVLGCVAQQVFYD